MDEFSWRPWGMLKITTQAGSSHTKTLFFFFFVYAWPRPVHFSYLSSIDRYRREQRSHTKLLTHRAAAQTNSSWTISKQRSTFSQSLLLIHHAVTLIKTERHQKNTDEENLTKKNLDSASVHKSLCVELKADSKLLSDSKVSCTRNCREKDSNLILILTLNRLFNKHKKLNE